MASAMPRRPCATVLLLLAAVLLLGSPVAAAGGAGCAGEKFPAGRSYAHCAALGQLGAALHWTYDAKAASLSLAFVAKPTGANGAGWVSWALNPTGDGMKGAQALVAFKSASSPSTYVVNTYNITGYHKLPATSTPIAFKATDLAADESGGKVRLYGKLQLLPGMDVVSHIWQVGSAVTNGAPAKHAFAKENLEARGKLMLSGGTVAPEPSPAPAPAAGASSSSAKAGSGGASPSAGKPSAAAAFVPAPALMLLALAGFLAIV
ncbi:hypothetical protein ACP70R_007105 [Stipagrostis hirtigluma subsp. patula]